MKRTYLVPVLALGLAGCGPTLLTANMPNPARVATQEGARLHATQGWQMGPVKENHQYELTLDGWTPQSVLIKVHLTDTGRCADPASYLFQLVDERGQTSLFHQKGEVQRSTRKGQAEVTLTETTTEGEFLANVGADARYVVVTQRPQWGYDCPSLDYRWNFE